MDNYGELLIYQTEDGLTKIDVTMQEETVWFSQAEMTKLFQTTKQNISLHINNIFKDGELERDSVVKEYIKKGVLSSCGCRKILHGIDDLFGRTTYTAGGENLFIGNGTVSHLQAMEKAQTEYKKYKAKTLSSVEKDYLESIKQLEQNGKRQN